MEGTRAAHHNETGLLRYRSDQRSTKKSDFDFYNELAGNIEPFRLLISEGKVVRRVTGWSSDKSKKKRMTVKHVARGPVASISTTTKNRLQVDDENRHISVRVNESTEQTRQIIKASARASEGLTPQELRVWHTVHRLLENKIGIEITFPEWFGEIADRVSADDLRARRYFPAFLEACRVVCLIRSFQKDHGQ